MAVKCTNCGGSHPKWDCTKPAQKSTAPRKDEARHGTGTTSRALTITDDRKIASGEAGTQALPVDTNMGGESGSRVPVGTKTGSTPVVDNAGSNPAPSQAKFDRNEYQRLYMRDKATIKRLGLNCTVSEWRKRNAGDVG